MSLNPITLICFGCGARFRLVPKGDRFPRGVKCPKCGNRIDLPRHLVEREDDVVAPAASPTSESDRRVDEGGPDLLALLGDQPNFPTSDAPLEDACESLESAHAVAPLPRRVVPGAAGYAPRRGVDDGHLFSLGLVLAMVTATAALLTLTAPPVHRTPGVGSSPTPTVRHPPESPPSQPTNLVEIEPVEDESALRLRLDAGETGLGASLARTMASDPGFRPSHPLLRARDQFFFAPQDDAWAPTWRAATDGPRAEFLPGARAAASAAMAWRISTLIGCRVDIPRAREALVPADQIAQPGAVVVTGLGAFTVGAWVEPASDPSVPLADRALWTAWLRPGPPGALDQPAVDLLAPMDALDGGAAARQALRASLGERSGRSLAASLSDALVWAWLTGSEGLFEPSDRRPPFGVGPAGISVTDLGPAFGAAPGALSRSPLRDTVRFRRATLAVLRDLDRDATRAALEPVGPVAGQHADALFAFFWTRRAALLARVDALLEELGDAEVYYFD